jgi:hypothetical protein
MKAQLINLQVKYFMLNDNSININDALSKISTHYGKYQKQLSKLRKRELIKTLKMFSDDFYRSLK